MNIAMCVALALQDPQPQGHQEHLKRLEFLIGAWSGKRKAEQGEFVEEASYEWSHDRNFVRHSSVTKSGGKTVWTYTGMIGWDAERKKLSGFYFGMDGTLGWGEQADDGAKDEFVVEGRASNAEKSREFRVRVRKVDENRISVTNYAKKEGKFAESGTLTYDRRKDGGANDEGAAPAERMKPFEFLIGSWVGPAQLGDMNVVEETKFEWAQQGHFIRTTERITSEGQVIYTATGMIGWDTEKKKYVWFHFGMEGSIGWAMGGAPEKDEFMIEGALRGDQTVMEYRVKYKILGRDRFSSHMEIKRDDRWAPFLSSTAERKK